MDSNPIGSMYAIYGNMDPITIPPMFAYIPYMDPMGMVLMRFQNYVFTNVSFHHPMVSKTSVCVKKNLRFYGDGENGIGFSKPSLLDFWLFWWNI